MTDFILPPGACDCHMHVYAPGFSLAPTATFQPPMATVADYREVQQRLGLERVVVVQPTGYGFDNACTLDALAQLGASARGVAVVPPDVADSTLDELHAAGMRGVRFMMLSGGVLPWSALETLAARIAGRDWHINLQIDGRSFAEHEARLSALPCRIAVDHLGKFLGPTTTTDASFVALCRLLERGRTWIKLSAPYESSAAAPAYADIAPMAQALAERFPERALWGTNWPHPNRVPRPDERPLLEWIGQWVQTPAARTAMLVDNPALLYGF